MKRSDIDVMFTEKVREFLMNGYSIHTMSMSGSQGEEGKVDLVKGDKLVRVWLDKGHGSFLEDDYIPYYITLSVGTWKYPAKNIRSSSDTAWMMDFEIDEEIYFYSIDHDSHWYTMNMEEAISCSRLSLDRYRAKKINVEIQKDVTNPKSIEIARKYLIREVGYRRVSNSDIKVSKFYCSSKKKLEYIVDYKGHSYFIY